MPQEVRCRQRVKAVHQSARRDSKESRPGEEGGQERAKKRSQEICPKAIDKQATQIKCAQENRDQDKGAREVGQEEMIIRI